MPLTSQQLAAGVAAAEKYEGWIDAEAIGETHNEECVEAIAAAADAGASQTAAGRQASGVAALTKIIDEAGYGDEVTAAMISGVVEAVLAAI